MTLRDASGSSQRIVDAHCHVPSTRFMPQAMIASSVENMAVELEAKGVRTSRKRVIDFYCSHLQDHTCDKFVQEMDLAGVSETVLLLPDFTFALGVEEYEIGEMIQLHFEIVRRHPGRFRYMCGVDPRWGIEGVDLFENAVKNLDCSGLKLYPPCGYSPSDPSLYPFYEICRKYALPVLLHTGPTSPVLSFSSAEPGLVDEAARIFSDVNFILAHAGVVSSEAAIALAAFRPNVYVDISGFAGAVGPDDPIETIKRLFRTKLSHKILFGTDWPIFALQQSYELLVKGAVGEGKAFDGMSNTDAELILWRNAHRLFRNKPMSAPENVQ